MQRRPGVPVQGEMAGDGRVVFPLRMKHFVAALW
jgi:hypothetical protein